jgi:hypothetical protein
VLSYEYRAGSARLDDLPEVPISPHLYVLCDRCATSLRPPRGWILDDRRSPPVVAPVPEPELVVELDPSDVPVVAARARHADLRIEPEPRREPDLRIEPEPRREPEAAPEPAGQRREARAEPEPAGQRQLAFGYSA